MIRTWILVLLIFMGGCKGEEELERPVIPRTKISDSETKALLSQVNSLEGEERECKLGYVEDYQEKVFAHCEKSGDADEIAGGCYHVAINSVHQAVLIEALKHCNIEPEI